MESETSGVMWHGRCLPVRLTQRVPKHATPAFNLNRFQSKQLFYRVCYPLSKKIKVGKEGKN